MISSFFLGVVSGEVEIYAKEKIIRVLSSHRKLTSSLSMKLCFAFWLFLWYKLLTGLLFSRCILGVNFTVSVSLCSLDACTICCFFSVTYYPLPWFWKFVYRIPLTWMSCFGYNTITFSHGSMTCSSACPMTFNVREAWNVISSRNQLDFATCLYSYTTVSI